MTWPTDGERITNPGRRPPGARQFVDFRVRNVQLPQSLFGRFDSRGASAVDRANQLLAGHDLVDLGLLDPQQPQPLLAAFDHVGGAASQREVQFLHGAIQLRAVEHGQRLALLRRS